MSLIKVQPEGYYNEDAIERVMNFCYLKCEWWSGFGIRTDSLDQAILDMRRLKNLCFKTDGKQLYHLEISIWRPSIGCIGEKHGKHRHDENASCYLIANEIGNILFNKGYQFAVFKHKSDTDEHLHFVINSVNYITQYKLSDMLSLSNELYHYLKKEYPFLKFNGPYFV